MADRRRARGTSVVVNALVFANVAVFLLWTWTPVAPEFMAEHFLVSWWHLANGRVWVLLTSVFSHQWAVHLLVNMIVLLSFGPPMERLMGSGRFLSFYLVAGIVGSFAHAAVSNFLMGTPELAALGASAAVAGVLLLFALTYPKAKVLLFFFIPLPAIVAALGFVAIDIWGLIRQIEGTATLPIKHKTHLGGALTGGVYFLLRRRRLRLGRRRVG